MAPKWRPGLTGLPKLTEGWDLTLTGSFPMLCAIWSFSPGAVMSDVNVPVK